MAYHTKTDGEKHFPIMSADGVDAVSYVYQPVICASTKEILYFEQLARFEGARDDDRRTQTIIEWLEVTGDIIAFDIHSFDVAIVALLENDDINIGVNISGATLSKKDACAEIIARLKDAAAIAPVSMSRSPKRTPFPICFMPPNLPAPSTDWGCRWWSMILARVTPQDFICPCYIPRW